MIYLVAVKLEEGNDIFQFHKKESRDELIQELKSRGVEYSTTEIE